MQRKLLVHQQKTFHAIICLLCFKDINKKLGGHMSSSLNLSSYEGPVHEKADVGGEVPEQGKEADYAHDLPSPAPTRTLSLLELMS